MDAPAPETPPRKRPSLIPLGILVLVLVAALITLWSSSLRRDLDDATLAAYLRAEASDRDVYHAAEEIARRVARKDDGRKRFYPALATLARSPDAEKRKVVAWVMGEDPAEESFLAPLRALAEDPVAIVAHNAALALVRHRSDAGRPVLLAMLQEIAVKAPAAGKFRTKLKAGDTGGIGHSLGTIEGPVGKIEIPTPIPGRVLFAAADGATVASGDLVARLAAAQSSALQALRALALPGIGRPEDVVVIETFLKSTPDVEREVADQAKATIAQLTGR